MTPPIGLPAQKFGLALRSWKDLADDIELQAFKALESGNEEQAERLMGEAESLNRIVYAGNVTNQL